MSGKPKPAVQRIHINRDGYDAEGAYYAAGQPVFLVTWPNGGSQAIRAATLAKARAKAAVMLDKGIADARRQDEERAALMARAAENAARRRERTRTHRLTWTSPVDDQPIEIAIRHTKNYLVEGTDHIEVESLTPARAALPITETGYLSHFIDWRQLKEAGGLVAFVEGWLARETRSKDWQKKDLARRQGDLFQWAEANAETGKRTSRPKVKRPDGVPAARPRPGRTPR